VCCGDIGKTGDTLLAKGIIYLAKQAYLYFIKTYEYWLVPVEFDGAEAFLKCGL
jgi:hypothetical protein